MIDGRTKHNKVLIKDGADETVHLPEEGDEARKYLCANQPVESGA